MEYLVEGEKIVVIGKEDFCPKDILECGQFFRYYVNNAGNFVALSGNAKCEIIETEEGFEILTANTELFEELFNLKTDYSKIKQEISSTDFIAKAVNSARGLRIVKNNVFETICSFIISANNNIKRIKLILFRLCEKAGKKIDEQDYAFPDVEVFSTLDEDFFKGIGAGYRARYLAELYGNYKVFEACNPEKLPTKELRAELLKIKGVGRKVADCILLFAFNRFDVFPVDVWMERVYYEHFGKEELTREKISEALVSRFGTRAGFVQQYLFYSKIADK